MTPMLEKIARAIGDVQLEGAPVGLVLTSDEIASVARAALLAMRNVDREVLQVGAYAYDDERAIAPVWSAMIDAILKEGGE